MIKLIQFDAQHYATNLIQTIRTPQDEAWLKWESVGASHFMIVRDEFGVRIKLTDEFIESLNGIGEARVFSGDELQVGAGKHLIILPRSGINSYAVPVKPAQYAVFACSNDGDEFVIYNPTAACFYQCSVSADVRVSVKKAPVLEKGFLEKIKSLVKTDEGVRNYYNVKLPEIPNYKIELLCYGYDGCDYKFPITSMMLNKTVIIPERDGKKPRVECFDSTAYKIVMES